MKKHLFLMKKLILILVSTFVVFIYHFWGGENLESIWDKKHDFRVFVDNVMTSIMNSYLRYKIISLGIGEKHFNVSLNIGWLKKFFCLILFLSKKHLFWQKKRKISLTTKKQYFSPFLILVPSFFQKFTLLFISKKGLDIVCLFPTKKLV